MSRYRKINPRFWKDEKISTLNRDEKLIALYLFTSTQSNRIGLFSFSPAGAAEDLGIALETFGKGFMKPFQTVVERLHLGWDAAARVLYIPTWWKYNCPENPNVLKACLADLHEVPQTPLIAEFSNNLRYLPETFHQTFREALGKPSPQPCPIQEQEQKQEQEYKRDIPVSTGSLNKRIPRLVNKPKPEASPKPDPRIKPFFDFWKQEFERRFGQSYPFRGGKEGSLIKRLPESYDIEKLKSLATVFFDLNDPWISQQGGYTIGVFCSQIAKLVSTGARNADRDRQHGGFVG